MTNRYPVSALEQKYAELIAKQKAFEAEIDRIRADAGVLEQLEARVREISETLIHLEASIRTFKEDWAPPPPFGASRRPGRGR